MSGPHAPGATLIVADTYGVSLEGEVAINQTCYRWSRKRLPDEEVAWPRGVPSPFVAPFDFEPALVAGTEVFFELAPALLVELLETIPASFERDGASCVVDRSVYYEVRPDRGLTLTRSLLLAYLASPRSRDQFSLQVAKPRGEGARVEPPGVTASSEAVRAAFERLEQAWRPILTDDRAGLLLDRPEHLP